MPETALAEAAGCAVEDGILVDARGRTSVEGIYAAGDGARFYHPGTGAHMRLEAWQQTLRQYDPHKQIVSNLSRRLNLKPW